MQPSDGPGQESSGTKSTKAQQVQDHGDGMRPTAQQWLGEATTDPMTLLAGGMVQLQAVMLQQLSNEKDRSGEKSPETVKPGVSALPALPRCHRLRLLWT